MPPNKRLIIALTFALMVIAVDARNFEINGTVNRFIKGVFYGLAKLHPEQQFLFFVDDVIVALQDLPVNVSAVPVSPKPTNFLLYKWWYDVKVYLALKKHKADIFVCTNGICSLTTSIPQLLIVPDLSFIQNPGFLPKNIRFFYRQFIKSFLKKAAVISVFSDFTKKEITANYAIAESKLAVITLSANSLFKPLQWEDREKVKEHYAQGCEYFYCNGGLGSPYNIIHLLKAFSLFKKRQKTNMKLVIAGSSEKFKNEAEKISLYKYKDDVHLTGDLSAGENANLTSAAYAMILPSVCPNTSLDVLEAMQCGVPVITAANESVTEVAGEAALYIDAAKPEEVAEQMKRIFKDELLRNQLIAAGTERTQLYNTAETTSLAWQAIEKVVSR